MLENIQPYEVWLASLTILLLYYIYYQKGKNDAFFGLFNNLQKDVTRLLHLLEENELTDKSRQEMNTEKINSLEKIVNTLQSIFFATEKKKT